MQRIYLLLFGILLSAMVHAQHVTGEERAVQQAIEKMFTALTNGDTTALKLYCTGDVKFYEYGQVWPIDTLIQDMIQIKSIKDVKRTNRFDFVSTTIHKQTAWVTYYLESIITANGKLDTLNWLETVVLVKQKGQWKIDVLHSTRIIKK